MFINYVFLVTMQLLLKAKISLATRRMIAIMNRIREFERETDNLSKRNGKNVFTRNVRVTHESCRMYKLGN